MVVTDVLSLQRIWFNIYHSDYYVALQSLMTVNIGFKHSKMIDPKEDAEARVRGLRDCRLPVRNATVSLFISFYSPFRSVENCRYLTQNFTQLPGAGLLVLILFIILVFSTGHRGSAVESLSSGRI